MTVERFEAETFKAGADLSAGQYRAVELTSNAFEVTVCNGAGDNPIGVLQNKPKSGEAATIAVRGICRVVSDGNAGAIAIGDYLGTDAAGKLVKKSADKAIAIGRALEASTADGTIISAFLFGTPLTLSV